MLHITSNHKQRALAGIAIALVVLASYFVLSGLGSATAQSASLAPVSSVQADQARVFPVLRGSAAVSLPDDVRRWGEGPMARQNSANVTLARVLHPSADSSLGPAYLIPGKGAVCLFARHSATCQPLDQVRTSGISLQFIPPNNESKVSPLPPPGQTVKSTIVAVAAAGVTSITAPSSDGADVKAQPTADGSFTLAGADLQWLTFHGATETARAALFHN
jgi:hypothetical protein